MAGEQLIDWDVAARSATALIRPGPELSRAEAAAAVADLRAHAENAIPHVRAVTRLSTDRPLRCLVVDRPGWARANVAGFRAVLGPAIERATAQRTSPMPAALTRVGGAVTGAELGALLAFLSSKVLGQFDPFAETSDADAGRLLLVAPNIVALERELDVRPRDFRLWVCLHEETHRLQFEHAGWLAPHLQSEVTALLAELLEQPRQLADRMGDAMAKLPEMLRGGSVTSLLDLVQTPPQRERLARLTAAMSLVEGHAEVVMDAVGPDVVPTVATIRERFSRRRGGRGVVDQLLRRMLGLDAKLRQYADGARFVRAVQERVGVDGFNRVFDSPATLPSPAEIADPAAWVARVHG